VASVGTRSRRTCPWRPPGSLTSVAARGRSTSGVRSEDLRSRSRTVTAVSRLAGCQSASDTRGGRDHDLLGTGRMPYSQQLWLANGIGPPPWASSDPELGYIVPRSGPSDAVQGVEEFWRSRARRRSCAHRQRRVMELLHLRSQRACALECLRSAVSGCRASDTHSRHGARRSGPRAAAAAHPQARAG
jgi:hypothetical protein